MKGYLIGLLIFLITPNCSTAQTERYSFHFNNVTYAEALDAISKTTGYTFAYVQEILPDETVKANWQNVTIHEALNELFANEILTYRINGKSVTVYSIRSLTAPFQIFGRISDAENGEVLTSANVYTDRSQGVTTDGYGLYSLEVDPKRDSAVFFSFLGYKLVGIRVKDMNKGRKNIHLTAEENILFTVTITPVNQQLPSIPTKDLLINKTYANATTISGESDVIEFLNAIPGLVKMSEGRSGFSVHGSATDQNLILIDEAPIFNPGHALGFLSIFNTEALNAAAFHKSAISSKYGGRLTSVLDVRMREGHAYNHTATLTTNPFYTGITLEGPVLENKMSFLVSGRVSHLGYLLNRFDSEPDFYIPKSIKFYDLHGKINFRLGNNNRFYLSSFINNDNISPHKPPGNNFFYDTEWQNRTLTLRWNSILSEKLFTNLSFVFSDYEYLKSAISDTLDFRYQEQSSISNGHLKLEANYHVAKGYRILAGVNATSYNFSPATGSITIPTADTNFVISYKIANIKSRELALFFENQIKIGKWLNLNAGLRYSRFFDVGNNNYEFEYNDIGEIIDSTFRPNNKVIRTFDNWEPRLSADIQIHKNWLIQAALSRTSQYIIRLLNENPTSPNEYWIPAGSQIKPLKSEIWSASLQWQANSFVNLRFGCFHRESKNVATFKSGSSIFFTESLIDRQITQGEFESSGLEFSLIKEKKNIQYNLSYTWSRAKVRYPDINNGLQYSAPQEYHHDFNIQGLVRLNKRLNGRLNLIWRSGDLISLPSGVTVINGVFVDVYTERNNFKLPNYLRLDVSGNWKLIDSEHFLLDLNFGVYNLTGRLNPFQVNVVPGGFDPQINILALSNVTPFLHFKLKYR